MSAEKKRLYFLLQRSAHRLKTKADAALREVGGLTTAQAAVMSIIVSDGPVTQKHIAGILVQRESAMTAMVARLLNAGFITKSRSTNDARAVQLSATAAGQRAVDDMRKPFDEINAALDRCVNSRDMGRLAEILTKILDEKSL